MKLSQLSKTVFWSASLLSLGLVLCISPAYAADDEKDHSCTLTFYAGSSPDDAAGTTSSPASDDKTSDDKASADDKTSTDDSTATDSKTSENAKKPLWEVPETWINGIFMIDEDGKMTPLTNTQLYVCVDGNKLHKSKTLISKVTLPNCSAKAELVFTGILGSDKSCPAPESPSTGSLGKSRDRFVLLSKCFKNIYNIKDNQVFQTVAANGITNGMYKKIDGLWDHNFDNDLCKGEE